jgi:hypothetical protein
MPCGAPGLGGSMADTATFSPRLRLRSIADAHKRIVSDNANGYIVLGI